MKIVHVCLSATYNDDWGYQENLIPKYNALDGHDVTLITSTQVIDKKNDGFSYIDASTYCSKDGFKVIRVPFISCFFADKLIKKLRIHKSIFGLLEQESPDLIFVHGFYFMNIKDIKKYKILHPKVKLAFDSHASFSNSAKNIISKYVLHKFIWKRKLKFILPFTDKIFSVAPACTDFLVEMYGLSEETIDLLLLGADTNKIDFENKHIITGKIRSKLDIGTDDFVFVTGGKLSKKKAIKKLLLAFREIKSEKIKLIIFGEFTEDIKNEMLDMIASEENVRYVGWIQGEEVYDYYLASNVAVFPGTKSALWEQAICCGLPIICRRWEGIEHINLGNNALFLDDVAQSLKLSMELIMNDKVMYSKMKSRAEEKGIETFSYEIISRKALDF